MEGKIKDEANIKEENLIEIQDDSSDKNEVKSKILKNKEVRNSQKSKKKFLLLFLLLLVIVGIGLFIIYVEKNGKDFIFSARRTRYVYITRYGRRYHRTGHCGNSKHVKRVSLSRARALGYTPCRKCYR